jgi:hypothetical protein
MKINYALEGRAVKIANKNKLAIEMNCETGLYTAYRELKENKWLPLFEPMTIEMLIEWLEVYDKREVTPF